MDHEKLIAELSRDEGRKLAVYQDTNMFWTIGVGHLLGSHPRMTVITEAECDALLEVDIQVAAGSLDRVLPGWRILDDVRQRALINMMFNRGEQHMRESTTITPALKVAIAADVDHDIAWNKVTSAIKMSPWAKQIGARADRLALMLEKGVTV